MFRSFISIYFVLLFAKPDSGIPLKGFRCSEMFTRAESMLFFVATSSGGRYAIDHFVDPRPRRADLATNIYFSLLLNPWSNNVSLIAN